MLEDRTEEKKQSSKTKEDSQPRKNLKLEQDLEFIKLYTRHISSNQTQVHKSLFPLKLDSII